jgi:hypothetical protein
MAEITRIRWHSPAPTSVDEELVAYDDGSAWLVVRTARDGSPTIGTWRSELSPEDRTLLDGVRREVDLLDRHPDPLLASVQRVVAAVREHPVATATFHVGVVAPDGELALFAVGGGLGPAAFELDRDAVIVHLIRAGTEIGWHPVGPLQVGFVSPEPAGLGGLARPAEIAPGAYGAIALPTPAGTGTEADAVALGVSGYLRDGLPEGAAYRPFTVRTADVPLRG